jgi:sigma54-dependent transcription regulator
MHRLFLLIVSFCQRNVYDLRFVRHDQAVKYVELACAESRQVTLCIRHEDPPDGK